jgi:uncharacterized DUF497 family protein
MRIEFDHNKSEKNTRERGLSFEEAAEFDWETAIYAEDDRKQYPEQRFIAIGHVGTRLHVICFTPIDGGVRIISFRKANSREVRRHEKETINK